MGFLPYDTISGEALSAFKRQKNDEAFEAKFPVRGGDILSFYMARAIWGSAQVPTSALNLTEIFNSSTGLFRALGRMDVRHGLRLVRRSATTFSVTPGFVLHRGLFKTYEVEDCDTDCGEELLPGALLIPGECASDEGNASGLDYADGLRWYYVYAKLDSGGAAPDFRVSKVAPVFCAGLGWEHPSYDKLRYIGALKPMADGSIRPFATTDHGWTYYMGADVESDDDNDGYMSSGTAVQDAASWVRYEEAVTSSDYHDGPRHIPPTARAVRIDAQQTGEDLVQNRLRIRPCGSDSSGGHGLHGRQVAVALGSDVPTSNSAEFVIPVNMCWLDEIEMQKFEYRMNAGDAYIDVAGYYEEI